MRVLNYLISLPMLMCGVALALLATCNVALGDPENCNPCPTFIRGDAEGDGGLNVTDMIIISDCIQNLENCPDAYDAADVNDDGVINVTDVIYLRAFLFQGGPPPPAPFPQPGLDPTPDALDPLCDVEEEPHDCVCNGSIGPMSIGIDNTRPTPPLTFDITNETDSECMTFGSGPFCGEAKAHKLTADNCHYGGTLSAWSYFLFGVENVPPDRNAFRIRQLMARLPNGDPVVEVLLPFVFGAWQDPQTFAPFRGDWCDDACQEGRQEAVTVAFDEVEITAWWQDTSSAQYAFWAPEAIIYQTDLLLSEDLPTFNYYGVTTGDPSDPCYLVDLIQFGPVVEKVLALDMAQVASVLCGTYDINSQTEIQLAAIEMRGVLTQYAAGNGDGITPVTTGPLVILEAVDWLVNDEQPSIPE